MRIAVYTIAKNEEKHVKRWFESAKDADYLIIADTGSTDKTAEIVKSIPQIQFYEIKLDVWRFDVARNMSIDLIPEDVDVCICLDMDEILMPGWRSEIERAWQLGITNRMSYNFIWNFLPNGQPGLQFQSEKIHGRFSHRWTNAVHEVLKELPNVTQNKVDTSFTLIEHHADDSKSRGQYLPLLELDAKENPNNDRQSHYLGREYYFYKRYDEAIVELQRHLSLPKAVWKSERAASMRYIAKCYNEKYNQSKQEIHFQNTEYWYQRAIQEDTTSREARTDLANFYLYNNKFDLAIIYAQKALDITTKEASYLREAYAQNEGPYDIMGTAYYYLQDYDKSIEMTQKAIALNPNDKRLHDNLMYAEKKKVQ